MVVGLKLAELRLGRQFAIAGFGEPEHDRDRCTAAEQAPGSIGLNRRRQLGIYRSTSTYV